MGLSSSVLKMCALFLAFALAGWYGSRRSRMRSILLATMVGVACFIGILFAEIAVEPLLNIPQWLSTWLPLVIIVSGLIMILRKFMASDDPLESTPDKCWKGAVIYYNPDDAALFVQKRFGIGYTFNFANPWSWILLLGLALVIASAVFL
jgi:uncharacterized membrane protein